MKITNIPFYYNKRPCPEGHLAPFYVEANYCVSCTKQKTAKSDRKNKKIYNRIKHFSLESKIECLNISQRVSIISLINSLFTCLKNDMSLADPNSAI